MVERLVELESWKHFYSELELKFENKEISIEEINQIERWIRKTLKDIENKDFDYYLTTYPSEEYQKIDIAFLIDRRIYLFTLYEGHSEFSAFLLSHLDGIQEDTDKNMKLVHTWFYFRTSENKFFLVDKIESQKLKEFTQKIIAKWGN